MSAATVTAATTREAWLQRLAELVRPWYVELGLEVPAVRIGVGFTSKGARSTRIGECWHPAASADGVPEIYVHPTLHEPIKVAETLVHELLHAALPPDTKHGAGFRRPALALGLTGRMTATAAGPALVERLTPVLEQLGPYPHAAFTPRVNGTSSAGPKQTTRMLKCTCSTCGYTVRTTRKWLELAVPACPVDGVELEVQA